MLLMLALTGVLIYPLDQFGLHDRVIQSAWLPARYDVNTWRGRMRSLAVTPAGQVYAAHQQGIFVSPDGGQSWHDITAAIPGRFDTALGEFPPLLAMHPSDEDLIMASKGRGLARSTNGGDTWEPYGDSDDEDLSHRAIQAIMFAPPSAVSVIDEHGLLYQRRLDPDEDDGWELSAIRLPYGDQRGVGVLPWHAIALYAYNGQLFSDRFWWGSTTASVCS